jgi:hypothetical protein
MFLLWKTSAWALCDLGCLSLDLLRIIIVGA